ncbi:hypothetical protein AB0M54_27925 [Actinoplanes sp. NPDC051470]|uniref:hypothetical protein n=1 Tax=unclassified Actinoplanes TaxID=2626549 RepID=UPI0034385E33
MSRLTMSGLTVSGLITSARQDRDPPAARLGHRVLTSRRASRRHRPGRYPLARGPTLG